MDMVLIKIKRQDDPEDLPYWEQFEVEYKAGMTVMSLLVALRENLVTLDGNKAAPIAHESSCGEGMCGACSMIINGKAKLACQTLIDELDMPVTLEPLSKFPVVRDLKVDRTKMFDALSHMNAWISLDGGLTLCEAGNLGLRISPEEGERFRVFSSCIMCGACSEACPQVNERSSFAGAFIFSLVLPLNSHPIGLFDKQLRLDAMSEKGGIADCMGAKTCEVICPKKIPLSEGIARLEWMTFAHSVRRLFWG